ncbi:DUF7281 domain-containing protein [Marinobacter salsuginis]|uniref:DUF7281 domain-containing protein n=1 Tax=Marinobacter salsuginis TaxID=418719 RepID=A0A5M3Q5T2_9GAMM|nr:hypothetical protein [Marinobacter salsuginis]GBO90449.1 hypothetical protein MSSD14B_41170 [Marinobacter salsuginis]
MKPSRREIQQALKVVQSASSNFTVNQTLKELQQRGFGYCVGKEYRIERLQKRLLKDWLRQHGINWQTPWSAFSGDRVQTAASAIDEKLSKRTDEGKRILMGALGCPAINGQQIPQLPGGYLSMPQEAITWIECDYLVLVENYPAFTRLSETSGHFKGLRLLAVYRGDPERPNGQVWAREMAGRTGIPLAAYADFDPAGLCIAFQSGAQHLILPELESLSVVQGSAEDFTNQHIQWEHLRNMVMPASLQPYFRFLEQRREGFTQERQIAQHTTLKLVSMAPARGGHHS